MADNPQNQGQKSPEAPLNQGQRSAEAPLNEMLTTPGRGADGQPEPSANNGYHYEPGKQGMVSNKTGKPAGPDPLTGIFKIDGTPTHSIKEDQYKAVEKQTADDLIKAYLVYELGIKGPQTTPTAPGAVAANSGPSANPAAPAAQDKPATAAPKATPEEMQKNDVDFAAAFRKEAGVKMGAKSNALPPSFATPALNPPMRPVQPIDSAGLDKVLGALKDRVHDSMSEVMLGSSQDVSKLGIIREHGKYPPREADGIQPSTVAKMYIQMAQIFGATHALNDAVETLQKQGGHDPVLLNDFASKVNTDVIAPLNTPVYDMKFSPELLKK